MDYVNQDVICPKCGGRIMFDDFDDAYEVDYDMCIGTLWERCVYTCPKCGASDITAIIEYDVKFKRIVQ